jgi:hypothetical protein
VKELIIIKISPSARKNLANASASPGALESIPNNSLLIAYIYIVGMSLD